MGSFFSKTSFGLWVVSFSDRFAKHLPLSLLSFSTSLISSTFPAGDQNACLLPNTAGIKDQSRMSLSPPNDLLSKLDQARQTRLNNYLSNYNISANNHQYDLTPSPTHAYLETFDAYPSSHPASPPSQSRPGAYSSPRYPAAAAAAGSPMSVSTPPYNQMQGYGGTASPGSYDYSEKDPLKFNNPYSPHQPPTLTSGQGMRRGGGEDDGNTFGISMNQYGSDRYLAPNSPSDSALNMKEMGGNSSGYRNNNNNGNNGLGLGLPSNLGGLRNNNNEKKISAAKNGKSRKGCLPSNPKKRKAVLIGVPITIVLIIAIAVVGIYFGVIKPKSTTGSNSSGSSGSNGNGNGTTTNGGAGTSTTYFGVAGTGKTGSVVTTDQNVNFTYTNNLGGSWAQNPQNPYSVSFLFQPPFDVILD